MANDKQTKKKAAEPVQGVPTVAECFTAIRGRLKDVRGGLVSHIAEDLRVDLERWVDLLELQIEDADEDDTRP